MIGRRWFMAAGLLGLGAGRALAQDGDGPLSPGGLNPEPTFPLDGSGLSPETDLRQQLLMRDTDRRFLSLVNVATNETVEIVYYQRGRHLAAETTALDRFFRDWREDAVIDMDDAVFDLLHRVQRRAEMLPIHVTSGYRTPETNAYLASINRDVARNSFHMQGMAVDFHIPGVDLEEVRDWAVAEGAGGVGYYPDSGFIHMDTGPERQWEGAPFEGI